MKFEKIKRIKLLNTVKININYFSFTYKLINIFEHVK